MIFHINLKIVKTFCHFSLFFFCFRHSLIYCTSSATTLFLFFFPLFFCQNEFKLRQGKKKKHAVLIIYFTSSHVTAIPPEQSCWFPPSPLFIIFFSTDTSWVLSRSNSGALKTFMFCFGFFLGGGITFLLFTQSAVTKWLEEKWVQVPRLRTFQVAEFRSRTCLFSCCLHVFS